MNKRIIGLALIGPFLLSACVFKQAQPQKDDATPNSVTLIAYDAFTPEKGIFDDFTAATGAEVKIVTSGDTGTMVSKAVLASGNPEGDVMWGVDNTFLSRVTDAKVFESFDPVDEGDVCINYDKQWFNDKKLVVPSTFEDLINPTYKGLLAVQDPVASSPGLAFLLATIAHFGESDWQTYWTSLIANDVQIAPDWTTAYTKDFTIAGGKYPMVVSYGSSPPAEVVYSSTPISEPPTGVIESTCFRQIEYAGVLRGTKNPNNARALVDYLLDTKFQESMPLTLFVFPVNKEAALPKVFQDFAVKPSQPLTIAPEEIERNREKWLDAWRALAL